jgi:hypothetical protein
LRVEGLGFRVQDLWFMIYGLEFRLRIKGWGSEVEDSGFRF